MDIKIIVTYLLILRTLVSSPLDILHDRRLTSSIRIIGAVELCAPHLDDVRKSLQQDAFDSLVKLGHPMFEVSIAFEV